MTQTTQCGFCRETYEVGDQTYTPDDLAAPLNQCAACARREARGVASATTRCSSREP